MDENTLIASYHIVNQLLSSGNFRGNPKLYYTQIDIVKHSPPDPAAPDFNLVTIPSGNEGLPRKTNGRLMNIHALISMFGEDYSYWDYSVGVLSVIILYPCILRFETGKTPPVRLCEVRIWPCMAMARQS